MDKNFTVSVDVKNLDVYKGLLNITQEILEDERISIDVRNGYLAKLHLLLQSERQENRG
jgi:hypothetical protein